MNEFFDRRRFQNADGPEFNDIAADDVEDVDANREAGIPGII